MAGAMQWKFSRYYLPDFRDPCGICGVAARTVDNGSPLTVKRRESSRRDRGPRQSATWSILRDLSDRVREYRTSVIAHRLPMTRARDKKVTRSMSPGI